MTSPSIVRSATAADECELWRLFRAHHAENALFELSEPKVSYFLNRVLRPENIPQDDCGPRGIIGVIGPSSSLEGAIMLVLSSPWYSDEITMGDCMNFIDPEHRRSNHARTLLSYSKMMVDQIRLAHDQFKMIVGVVSTVRTAAKVRLYDTVFGAPIGAYFMYPAPEKFDDAGEVEGYIVPAPPPRLRKYRPPKSIRLAARG